MAIDLGSVGNESLSYIREWSEDEPLLYALSVGAGAGDPGAELDLTTENSEGVAQQVLPTFGVILGQFGAPPGFEDVSFGDVDMTKVVHADQELHLMQPLATSGAVRIRRRIEAIYDKGSGAMVVTEAIGTDPDSDEILLSSRSGIFVREAGGFGGDRGPARQWARPERDPDYVVRDSTRPNQALLYRLTGDRNPLHSDPGFARRAGFERPILHGLATYGFACRALLSTVLQGDASRFRMIRGRFSRPVFPGDDLITSVWLEDGLALFQTATPEGSVVLDRGESAFS